MIKINISKRFSNLNIDANFESDAGVTALFGRSGCGKTTIVNMLAGLNSPDSGYIEVNGTVLFDNKDKINIAPEKRRIGYVFQEARLFPHMTVKANLEYGVKHHPPSDISFDQVVEMLGIVDLLPRKPQKLSGGEQQRVAIGRALLSNPSLLLMDEPLANLDMARKAEILPFIERLCEETSLPIVYVSHSMDEVLRLADTMVLMDLGKTIACGAVEDVTSRLDLSPMTGRYESGSVLSVTVKHHDTENGLSHLKFNGGEFLVPLLKDPIGQKLRLRVRSRDIILSLNKPVGVSTLNILHGRVKEIAIGTDDSPHMDVLLDVGTLLWARITKLSGSRLGILIDSPIYAMIKTVAIDRQSIGRRD